jgi:hypothetical protein
MRGAHYLQACILFHTNPGIQETVVSLGAQQLCTLCKSNQTVLEILHLCMVAEAAFDMFCVITGRAAGG